MSGRLGLPSPWTVIYDSECHLCAGCVNCLRRLDWLGRLLWIPARGTDPLPQGVTPSDLDRALHIVDHRGDVREGFFALRAMLLVLPVLAPLGLLMFLPLVQRLGVPLYRLVASNRCRVVRRPMDQ